MSENETIADIIAEMRHGLDKSWHEIDREWAHGLPDRLDAAWKRERDELTYSFDPTRAYRSKAPDPSAYAIEGMKGFEEWKRNKEPSVGNGAAMREALERIVSLTNSLDENCAVDPVEIRDIARDAFADEGVAE